MPSSSAPPTLAIVANSFVAEKDPKHRLLPGSGHPTFEIREASRRAFTWRSQRTTTGKTLAYTPMLCQIRCISKAHLFGIYKHGNAKCQPRAHSRHPSHRPFKLALRKDQVLKRARASKMRPRCGRLTKALTHLLRASQRDSLPRPGWSRHKPRRPLAAQNGYNE